MEFVESFGKNVDFTGLLQDHLSQEEAEACDANGDETLMAYEFGECVAKEAEALIEAEDWDALEAMLMRLHGVTITEEQAADGLAKAFEGLEVPEEEWVHHIGGVAHACWAAWDEARFEEAAWSLGHCIDEHGNQDGELQVEEVGGALEYLVKNDMLSEGGALAAADVRDAAGLQEGDTLSEEDVGAVFKAILEHEKVPKEEWG